MADLKPCPFCGSTKSLDSARDESGKWGAAACTECLARGPEVRTNHRDWYEHAEAAWNQRASGWRDIATAPKDGSDILAYLPDFDCRSVVHWARINNSGHWYDGWHVVNPTHWQSLPEPPKEGGANG